jgi:hypothetical protein
MNFQDIPVGHFFSMNEKVYQKTSKAKIREFGKKEETRFQRNAIVEYLGEDYVSQLAFCINTSK